MKQFLFADATILFPGCALYKQGSNWDCQDTQPSGSPQFTCRAIILSRITEAGE
jgi:hypothetical protein